MTSQISANVYTQAAKENFTQRKYGQDYYDVLDTFNKIAEKHPLLDKASERKMIERLKNDRATLNKMLFYHNIRIVLNLARKYVQKAESPADLLMNGARGLMTAAERFDISKNTKFNTYATTWVFKYILLMFYSKSPITGVNQTSLNELFMDDENQMEKIDYICNCSDEEISTTLSCGRRNLSASIDYSTFSGSSIVSPSREYEDKANNKLIHEVIDEISADPHFNEIDRDIIYNNMMSNNDSINSIAQRHKVPTKEVNKRKRKIITNFKTMLSSKYNINSLRDII